MKIFIFSRRVEKSEDSFRFIFFAFKQSSRCRSRRITRRELIAVSRFVDRSMFVNLLNVRFHFGNHLN